MATNRGKDFEKEFKTQIQAHFLVVRLADNTAGYLGSSNICDFISYSYPYMYFFELKTTQANTLPFSNISDNQWRGLLDVYNRPGVCAGVVVWFVGHDKTFFVTIDYLEYLKQQGKKSLNIKDCLSHEEVCPNDKLLHLIELEGTKRKVFFNYDISGFKSNLERLVCFAK